MDAFVLGGGGQLGAHEVGMLRALLERGIMPDLVVGTSIGAINGAAVASDPSLRWSSGCERRGRTSSARDVFAGSLSGRLGDARAHRHPPARQRRAARDAHRGAADPADRGPAGALRVRRGGIESAAEHWFTAGPLVDAVLASAAVPGILPPVEVGGEHFIDGGIVNTSRSTARSRSAPTRIFVMHVGRLDRPLEPPRWPWEVALVAFEIARRHRFLGDLASLPDTTSRSTCCRRASPSRRGYNDLSALRYRVADVGESIDRAHEASLNYLRERACERAAAAASAAALVAPLVLGVESR